MAYRKAVVDDIYQNHICSDTRHTGPNKVLQKQLLSVVLVSGQWGLSALKKLGHLCHYQFLRL